MDSKPKGVHVELVIDSMEEATHLIKKVMRGNFVKNNMVQKSDSPQPWPENNPPKPKINKDISDTTHPHHS